MGIRKNMPDIWIYCLPSGSASERPSHVQREWRRCSRKIHVTLTSCYDMENSSSRQIFLQFSMREEQSQRRQSGEGLRCSGSHHPASIINVFPFSRQSTSLHMSNHLKGYNRTVKENILKEKEMKEIKAAGAVYYDRQYPSNKGRGLIVLCSHQELTA